MTIFPEVFMNARAEVDAVIGRERLPTSADRPRLPYLNALHLELLRWSPVGPVNFPHELIEDDYYDGYFIPAGSIVIANLW